MNKSFEILCKTLEDTRNFAINFAKLVEDEGCFVCLYGDIGAGKTAFVRYVAQALGVSEKVTSPSFVILNEYYTSKLPIYHFDLYRLENEGVKTILDELSQYSEGKQITFVEWAQFSQNQIPFDYLEIDVTYDDNDFRKYSLKSYGEKSAKIVEGLKK